MVPVGPWHMPGEPCPLPPGLKWANPVHKVKGKALQKQTENSSFAGVFTQLACNLCNRGWVLHANASPVDTKGPKFRGMDQLGAFGLGHTLRFLVIAPLGYLPILIDSAQTPRFGH